ncbi:BNR repeat-containing protein [Pedobacter aquatilis]|uniref:BNR repeat-containing protein n=1 Tax=Pedobacter aquatilis TaxID=351343 RepID=UPI0025B56BB0|nr:BNR repeat-containing protein [Pedobacter aquatilis]MDN3587583.1 BNR repeat-containing protein [Pedobacter aquatilis]
MMNFFFTVTRMAIFFTFKFTPCFLLFAFTCSAQEYQSSTISNEGWSKNSVNAVIFRKNSLVNYKNSQYAAFYDKNQFVVVAKRNIKDKLWHCQKTKYQGDATDAHKSISIAMDGRGFLHLAWGQHNNQLNYVQSVAAESLIFGEKISMLGEKEDKVSYPEFYKLVNGDLLFFYRDGGSGNGNLMINRYSVKNNSWSRVQDGLINGEGKRNAYWQVATDKSGGLHISWVWRESPDVASNHDLAYAKSTDGGITWIKSTGEKYTLPITESNAEYALKIPQNSELINQTSMFADDRGRVFIAAYWRAKFDSIPQYHIVYKDDFKWNVNDLNFRKTSFTLNGGGTKKIPISRPQIIAWKQQKNYGVGIIFRDAERENKVSIATNQNILTNNWKLKDLTTTCVGDWEPSYDTELWKDKRILNLFIQKVTQIDGEGKADIEPSAVQVLKWMPF